MSTRKKLTDLWVLGVKEQREAAEAKDKAKDKHKHKHKQLEDNKKNNSTSKLTGRCKCGKCYFKLSVEDHCIIRTCRHCGDIQNLG